MMTGREIKDELLKIGLQLNDEAEYCSIKEFAAMYGYSPSSIRQMLMREQICGAVKVKDQWLIDREADILVKQNTKNRKIKL